MADNSNNKADIEQFKSDIPKEFLGGGEDEDAAPAQIGLTFGERVRWAVLLGAAAFFLVMILVGLGGASATSVFLAASVAGIFVGLLVLVPGILFG